MLTTKPQSLQHNYILLKTSNF